MSEAHSFEDEWYMVRYSCEMPEIVTHPCCVRRLNLFFRHEWLVLSRILPFVQPHFFMGGFYRI